MVFDIIVATSTLVPLQLSGYVEFFITHTSELQRLLAQHLRITILTLVLAIPLGITVGTIVSIYDRWSSAILWLTSIMQTIPSIALFGLLIPFLGIGTSPVVIALVMYAQLPIVRNTYIGLTQVNEAAVSVGRGLGMTRGERLQRVQAPLALPVIMAGIRNAVVLVIGIAAIGAFIGAGGLGDYLFQGIRQRNVDMIVVTTFVLSILTLVIDYGLGISEQLLRARNGESVKTTRLTRVIQRVIA